MGRTATLEIRVTGAALACRACGSTVNIYAGDDQREWRDRLNLWAAAHRMPRVTEVHTDAGTWHNRG